MKVPYNVSFRLERTLLLGLFLQFFWFSFTVAIESGTFFVCFSEVNLMKLSPFFPAADAPFRAFPF